MTQTVSLNSNHTPMTNMILKILNIPEQISLQETLMSATTVLRKTLTFTLMRNTNDMTQPFLINQILRIMIIQTSVLDFNHLNSQ